jgi:ADP-ribose pyrophosphatase
MIHVTIDMSLPENQEGNLKPQLEEDEFIEVFSIKLDELWAECRRLEADGYGIDVKVGALAEGIEMARAWGIR